MKTINRPSGTKRQVTGGPDRADRLASTLSRRQIGAAINHPIAVNDSARKTARRKRASLREDVSEHDDPPRAKAGLTNHTWLQVLAEQPVKSALIGLSLVTVASVGVLVGVYWMRR